MRRQGGKVIDLQIRFAYQRDFGGITQNQMCFDVELVEQLQESDSINSAGGPRNSDHQSLTRLHIMRSLKRGPRSREYRNCDAKHAQRQEGRCDGSAFP